MAKNPAGQIVDVSVQVADISWYRFLGQNAGQTITGYFVDCNNIRIGNSFSLAINQANGTNVSKSLNDVAGGIPVLGGLSQYDEAVGAIVQFSGLTYIDLATADTLDFRANYANYFSYSPSNGAVGLGRVNK